MAEHKINFVPNPLQKQFIESRAKADLFSSRMGEGKSTALAWSAFFHTRHNPGANWVIIRDTWENLRATTQKSFFEWFPPGIFGTYHATNKEFTWAEGVAKGTVSFLGMDDPQDATKLMSRDFGGFGMDEPAPAIGSAGIDELIFDIAMSRLRQKGMNWYAAKLAENNPDETHWSYRKFVSPGLEGFRIWQPPRPENEQNLPASYYAELRKLWAHRPDLIRRFVEGDFGFQAIGKAVTPQWSDRIHLAHGLIPIPRQPLIMLWDWGHNPTCIITQKTPLGYWIVLDALVGDGIGAEELVADAVTPLLNEKYKGGKHNLMHIGDPQGKQREQTSIHRSAVKMMRKMLGGSWRPGPVRLEERIEPLRAILARNMGGKGVIQVDKENAAALWHALRGGWHFNISRGGIVGGEPVKDIHSHPGDAFSYGAAVLFPMGKFGVQGKKLQPQQATYFGQTASGGFQIGKGKPGQAVPAHGDRLR